MSRIILNNIYKSFDKVKVLEDINLTVEEGELVSLLGPSGCGKTTTLKIISGLTSPDKGSIIVGDEEVNDIAIEKRGAVIVFQDYLLFPHLNVIENIGFGLKMAKKSKNYIKTQVNKMLDLVQLQNFGNRYPNELSGGQKQRVALARALAIEPKVLLLDEPFSNLDSKLKESVRDFTLGIQKELGITTILVTHEKEEAFMYSDKIAIMLDGKIRQFATPQRLYESPNSLDVADFLGENNFIQGFVKDGEFISNLIRIRTSLKNKNNAFAMIRPEDIEVSSLGILEGKITSRKYAGDRTYYKLIVKGQDLKLVTNSNIVYKVGDETKLSINKNKVLIFDEGGVLC